MASRVASRLNIYMYASSQLQYRYCTVCRRHHDQGRKHIFTKHYKEKLAGILAKILKKVRNKLT